MSLPLQGFRRKSSLGLFITCSHNLKGGSSRTCTRTTPKCRLFRQLRLLSSHCHHSTIPDADHHLFTLSDGRKFSYYTFRSPSTGGSAAPAITQRRHPVLYLHGFPGCGLEGGVCAAAVAASGGELYAPDRPGFGISDPLPESLEEDEDARLDRVISDLWEFVHHKEWPSFSVIGVSGGGPYALAFLSSYMDLTKTENTTYTHKLDAVCIVAGVCCSAGVDSMLAANQHLFRALALRKTSALARTLLRALFVFQGFLIRVVPIGLMRKLKAPDIPAVDQAILDDDIVGPYMIGCMRKALQQGASSVEHEASVIFRTKEAFRHNLTLNFNSENYSESVSPRVAIYHGLLDKNVPPSHSKFVHEQLLHGKANLVTYDDMGHVSLVVLKSADYSQFAVSRGENSKPPIHPPVK